MVEGLAEALAMFPKPSNQMTPQEYYDGERHCVLVTASDPIPRKMLLPVPKIHEGNYVGTQLETSMVDFLDVAQMFGPLAVTLSIITPKQHPTFGMIFSLGNNDSSMVSMPISNYRIGKLTVLLSKNFKEARRAIRGKRTIDFCTKENVESMKTTFDMRHSMALASGDQEDLFSAGNFSIEGQTIGAARNNRFESLSPLPFGVPNATINDETHVPSSSYSQSMNVYDDIMAELGENDIFLPKKKSKACVTTMEEEMLNDLFQPEQSIPLDEAIRAMEEEFRQVLGGIATQSATTNQTSTVDLTSISPMVPNAYTANAGEGSSIGLIQELGSNRGVVNNVLSSENNAISSFLLPQNNPNLRPVGPQAWYQPSGAMSTADRLGNIVHPPKVGSSVGDHSIFPHTTGNPSVQSQPHSSSPSLPMLNPYGIGNQHFPSYHKYQLTGFGPLGTPAIGGSPLLPPAPIMGQFNPENFWPRPPCLSDLRQFLNAWEGTLVGKILSNRSSLHKAKAMKRNTASFTLTLQWPTRLEIALFLPQRAVNHTKKICRGPIDYVFLQTLQFNNLDLYDYLMERNMCAKIDLPFQTLILSTTESKYHYLGTIFHGETMFVEPLFEE
ncbi:mediator of RNA polymerase II transcription subunit 25-like [Abrus precatorius]|uniref:Mediator of RNA polymerase II transcription subunit 25 n=1 Tax=Abrus precatorius TaxID=3816 RepID=A0A8B8LPP9_ABRPR|nr:mediator of RNA polymerase II transcription subunit 25-like [Abrus precatorius]